MTKLLLALSLVALPFSAHAAKAKTKPAAAKSETFKIDAKSSLAKWEGKKLAGAHQGELKVKGGSLTIEKGALTGGEVVIDMTSLKDDDLTDPEWNKKLVTHLKSDDFFSVEKNPTSSLKITKVEPKGDKLDVTGDLTIKGITKPITFPAEVKIEKNKLTAKGEMTVNRTNYDIKFRSLKFFPDIGDKVIKDEFTVAVDLAATK